MKNCNDWLSDLAALTVLGAVGVWLALAMAAQKIQQRFGG